MSLRPLRVLLLLALGAASVLALTGCGNKVELRTEAKTEGVYIDVGELKYQVQLSRIINPNDEEDRSYLQGLPAGTAPPGSDEAWFGVWMRVQNTTDKKTLTAADQFEIIDTQEHRFTPVTLENNPFAYQAQAMAPKTIVPSANSAAGEGVIQGSLILFKVTTEALANRPLEFKIQSPALPDDVGIVDLDV
ncbi:MAG: hypothetical protein QOH46_3051 [Solirubrobacteraceae bacterium]|nr:hypothetical protein [Solirubrobacteraceae bacterium]